MDIYLDNSATTRPADSVIKAMRSAMTDGYFNPSALYAPALAVEKHMNGCRDQIRQALHANGGQVIFTSGGTEADNLAILGPLKDRGPGGRVLYSAGEHPAVIESCKALSAYGYEVAEIALQPDGVMDIDHFEAQLTGDTRLICVMQANNETGAIQPLAQVSKLRDEKCPDALLHVDGVQGFLRHDCPVQAWGIDSYALSAHKIHGPKGIGALWVGERVRLSPILYGGGQEKGLRSGTENTPGIAGLSAAIASYPKEHAMRTLKLRLLERLVAGIPTLHVNGPVPDSADAADHILNLSFAPVRAETMLHALEAESMYAGNGSACSSRKQRHSHVLTAMGVPRERMESALRFSLSPDVDTAQIDAAAQAIIRNYDMLKIFKRR